MPQLELGTSLARGLRLRCPRCGGGKLFAGWFRMHPRCAKCDFKFERDAEILRSIKTLETINEKPAAQFWKEAEAGAKKR